MLFFCFYIFISTAFTNTYIIYLADDENSSVRSLNTVLDFTEVIDINSCMPEMTAKVSVDINNIEFIVK